MRLMRMITQPVIWLLISLSPNLVVSLSFAQCPGGVCPVPQRPMVSVEGRRPHPAVCRILNQFGRQQNFGTGTLVAKSADRALVITCAHLFREGTSEVQVVFPSGESHSAQLIAIDSVNDLAVLAIAPPRANPVTVNTEAAAGTLTACGYGQTGTFACGTGPMIGQATPVGAVDPSAKIGVPVRLGDSGGAVFAASGELCGVIWGVRDGVTYATCGRPLRRFLDRIGMGQGTRIKSREQGSQSVAAQASIEELAARIARLELRPEPVDADLSGYVHEKDFAAFRTQSEARHADGLTRIAAEARTAAVTAAKSVLAEYMTGLPQGISTWLPAALRLTGPAGLAVGALAWLGMRRIKKRLVETRQGDKEKGRRGEKDVMPRRVFPPIAVDTPPLPQQVVPETHYVTVQGNEYASAHQWAAEQVVRKYPGATEVLSTLEALIKQQLNAK